MPTVPRKSNSQILSGAPLVMPPRQPQGNSSSQMILTSIQLPKMETVGRSQSHLIGSSLQMSKVVINPGKASKTQPYLISKQVVKVITSENLRQHQTKHETSLVKSKTIIPVATPSQRNITHFSTTRPSLVTGVALQVCAATSECRKVPEKIQVQAPNHLPTAGNKTFYRTLSKRALPHGSRQPLHVLPQTVIDSRHGRSTSQSLTLPKAARTSQLAGASLQMSTAASQASKASSVILTRKHTPKAIIRVPCQVVGLSTRQMPISPLSTSTRLIVPSQMVGSSLHMRTAASSLPYHKSRM